MKSNLKKILVAASLIFGASLSVGSVNRTNAAVKQANAIKQTNVANVAYDAKIDAYDAKIDAKLQKFYDEGCLKSPDGEKIFGDRLESSIGMNNNGYYTKISMSIILKGDDDKELWSSKIKRHEESILKGKKAINVDIKSKDGQILTQRNGIKLNVEEGKTLTTKRPYKIESFKFELEGLNKSESEDKEIDLDIIDPETNKVIATASYKLPPTDRKTPKFVGKDGVTYACDRLVINYDGKEGEKNWLFDVPVRVSQNNNSFLKNHNKDLTVKLKNKTTNEEIKIGSKVVLPREYGMSEKSGEKKSDENMPKFYIDFMIEGNKLADGIYDIDLFDGDAKLGGFVNVELNSQTQTAGNCG